MSVVIMAEVEECWIYFEMCISKWGNSWLTSLAAIVSKYDMELIESTRVPWSGAALTLILGFADMCFSGPPCASSFPQLFRTQTGSPLM